MAILDTHVRQLAMRRVGMFCLAILVLLPGVGAQAPVPVDQTSEVPAERVQTDAAERLVDLGLHPTDPEALWLTFLAQQEHSGLLPPGTVDAMQAEADAETPTADDDGETLPPPRQVLRDAHRVCDLNHDGIDDILVNTYDYRLAPPSPKVSAYDGETGKILWNYIGIVYYFPISLFTRAWGPNPWVPDDVVPTVDVNNNGVCDFFFFGFTVRTQQATAVGSVAVLDVRLELHEGSTGAVLWFREFNGYVIAASDGLTTQTQQIQGFPTGLVATMTPTGPVFVFKLTDANYELNQDPLGLVYSVRSLHTAEHVYYGDARTGNDIWVADFPQSSNAKVTNLTWITGLGDITGDSQPDVMLDQMFIYNPQANTPVTPLTDPVSGQPVFQYGRGVSALAIRGGPAGGQVLWHQVIRDEGYGRVNTQGEELYNVIRWTHAQVLPDLNGDGAAEFASLILTREYLDATTINGAFRTILTPLSGVDGTLLWPGTEIRQQGWGFVKSLGLNPNATQGLAFGTIDLPHRLPDGTTNVPEARFPLKDVHISVLDVRDGSSRWSYSAQFPQDSYLSYDLALAQYFNALAPIDYDGDGTLEVVTPSEYVAVSGNNQTLLANAKHQYQVLRGTDGETLQRIQAWGSNGMVMSCGDRLIVVSGHGKEIDTSRVNVTVPSPVWRRTLYIDPTFTSATAGTDVVFLIGNCAGGDNRTFVSVNVGLNSEKRKYEIVPAFGMIDDDTGHAQWILAKPLMEPQYDFLANAITAKEAATPQTGEKFVWALAPAAPGALAGVAYAVLGRRKGGAV